MQHAGPFLDLRSPLGVTPAALKASGQAALRQTPESSPAEKPKRGAQPGAKPSRELTNKGGKPHALLALGCCPILSVSGSIIGIGPQFRSQHPRLGPLSALSSSSYAGPSTPAAKKAAASLAERPQTQRCYEDFQRSRAQLMRSATRRRAQSTAVDFRQVWWDKDRRAPSKTGMSIWRPLPPPGYVILGAHPMKLTHESVQALP